MLTRLRQNRLPLFLIAAVVISITLAGCDALELTPYYNHGSVASAAPLATELGVQVMKDGGNAFDAAVVVGFALAVVHPEAGNIGGGGFAVIRDARNDTILALDFRETAPGNATETMYLDTNGEVIENLSTVGALACGVPGTVAGLYELHRKYGILKWDELVRSAARLADSGFIVDKFLAERFADYSEELTKFESTRNWLMADGRIPQEGDLFHQRELGHTLAAIAADGPDAFYKGEIAAKIVDCVQAQGGIMTAQDLADYQPIWRNPIVVSFDSLKVYGMPPPSSGGILVGQILKLIEPYDLDGMTATSPEFAHLFSECCRRAFADRATHLGDPDFWEIPNYLLNAAYLDHRRSSISLDEASSSENITAGYTVTPESDNTTHFSIVDDDGNVVAITYTLNARFGSNLVVDEAGFLLNDEMDDFSIQPGHPNLYGLVGGEANKIEPRKRMLSSMSPTIVMKGGQPFLALGSSGGSKIITAVAQTILNLTRFGLTPEEAVAVPHIHHQWLPDNIRLESGGFDESFKQKLRGYGHELIESEPYGDLEIILIDHSGISAPASDPRQRGYSSGY